MLGTTLMRFAEVYAAAVVVVAMPLAAASTTYASSGESIATPSAGKPLDDYIRGLQYDNTTKLTNNGEPVANPGVTDGKLDGDTFTVVERATKSAANHEADISILNASASEVYPGAVVLADQDLIDNRPTVLGVPRAPLTLSVDLPGLDGDSNHAVVSAANKASTGGAVNTILERWNAGPAALYPNVSARLQYEESMAYSESQLTTKFGAGFSDALKSLNVNFDAVHQGKSQVQIASFKQIFYTANIDTPATPGSVFASDTGPEALKAAGVSNSAPPAYVSSVSYGRQIYVKLESSSTSDKVSAAFNAALKGTTSVDVSGNAEFERILKSSSFQALVFGGSANGHVKVLNGKLEDLHAAIQQESNYSRTNPGAPISYTVRYLKDNAQAIIRNTAEYVETKVSSYTSGKVRLNHSGGYVAQFNVNWDEVAYDKDGKQTLQRKEWDGNWQDRTAGFNTVISLPANARNINVYAREATGLAWEWWRTIADERGLPMVKERTLSIWGTTLSPQSEMTVHNP